MGKAVVLALSDMGWRGAHRVFELKMQSWIQEKANLCDWKAQG
jgi:hypothetical protein